MPLSIEQFTQRLTESGLLADDGLRAVREQVAGQDRSQDAQTLARALVRGKLLTAYQAQTLFQNKGSSLVLGNYVVLDKLGQGGMGVVLKALHRRMERIVALKVLAPAIAKDPALLQRFLREVQAAARLVHRNIVAAYDADETKGTHYLVMEYVEGTDLSAVVKQQGPLPVPRAVDCILQAARGLKFAHGNGVIHRDIKPANLLLSTEGVVKILDMGLARIEGGDGTQHELTSTGAVMGTVDYMAPEQAVNTKQADARSDVYSLGITLWYLLTGRAVYEGDSLMARLLNHRSAPIPSLQAARADASPELEAIFNKMVAKAPEQRHQSMDEVIRDLESVLDGSASLAAIVVAPTEDAKLSSFLGNLDAGTDFQPVVQTAARARTAAAGKSSPDVTRVAGDASSTTDPDSLIATRSRTGQVRRSRVTASDSKKAWWFDRRIQTGAGVGAAVLLVLGAVLFRGGDEEAPATLRAEPLLATSSNSGSGSAVKESSAVASVQPAAPPPVAEAPWQTLFDGTTATGWQTLGPFSVADGLLVADTVGNAVTADVYEDFELELEWRIEPGGNSGIYYRTPAGHIQPRPFPGNEYQVLDNLGHVNGRNPKTSAGGLYGVLAPTSDAARPVGTFNAARIVCRGPRVEHWLNGFLVVSYDQESPEFRAAVAASNLPDKSLVGMSRTGHVLLQGHTREVAFRNVRIRPLNPEERLPNGAADPPGPSGSAIPEDDTTPTGILTSPHWTWTEPVNLGKSVNSDEIDGGPCLSADGLSLLFASNRRGGRGYQDLWMCTRKGLQEEWSLPVNLGTAINTSTGENSCTVSGDGLSLIFNSMRGGHFDLYECRRPAVNDPWSAPAPLGDSVNSPDLERAPSLSADGLELYFVSNRAGGLGATDLWVSRRAARDAAWSPAVNLGDSINTPAPESSVSLASDDRSLLFVRGGYVWMSTRAGRSVPWSAPRPMAGPLNNSPLIAEDLTLSSDGRELIVEAHGPTGHDADLWRLARIPRTEADRLRTEAAAQNVWQGWPSSSPAPAIAPFDAAQAKLHQEAWAKHLGAPVEWTHPDGIEFVLVPPGEFQMGSTREEQSKFIAICRQSGDAYGPARIPAEGPRHRIVVSRPFYVGKHEVTQRQWEAVMGTNPSSFIGADHPVEQVSWNEAIQFVERLNGRRSTGPRATFALATDAQWEFACRAGTETAFDFGDDQGPIDASAWTLANAGDTTHPVGQLRPNAWGLYDMHGNVWEWCLDWYDPAWYSRSPLVDPIGPFGARERVIRGGSHHHIPARARSASRSCNASNVRQNYMGLRVVALPEAGAPAGTGG